MNPKTHHSFDAMQRVAVAVLAVILLMASLAPLSQSRSSSIGQDRKGVIKFSHKLHAKDQGIGCTDCHDAVPGSKLASDNLLAKKAACQNCHEDQLKSECTYCHVSDNKDSYVGFENPVRSIIFSHEKHTGELKAECATCHAGIEEAEVPSSGKIPVMATCNSCHDNVKAPNHCESCHSDLASLRPSGHNNKDFLQEHRRIARLSTATCQSCHTQESCQDCHNGGSLHRTLTKGNYVSSHTPRAFSIDRGQGQGVAKVHELNFKYTHGLKSAGRTATCQTCHDRQEFCATCHEGGGDVNQGTFLPQSHKEPGFKPLGTGLGYGDGGGNHARLARRDIESCAACHDAQGADPSCMGCHNDPDGIKHTNPRTHPLGFMHDAEDGNWHNDPGAVCYACHTDSNARPGGVRGQKFCSYCHN